MDAASLTATTHLPQRAAAPSSRSASAAAPSAPVLTNVDSIIDPRTVDWPSVRRARFQVRHHYRYVYRQPISSLEQRLVMTPPDRHVDQALLEHAFRVTGAAGYSVRWEEDRFGNRVARVSAPRVEEAVMFEAAYTVERDLGQSAAPPDLPSYLEPTALTAPDVRIAAVADEIRRELAPSAAPASADVSLQEQLAERAHDWASHAITYQVGVTGVQTPAAMALHLGSGVCQDYAHILLALLRLLGVPARYVSGHLLGEGVPHAWVETFIGGGSARVIAYDPTHHRRAGLQYVTVATGRDFADVSPTSGSFTGAAPGLMTWGKHAALVDVEYASVQQPSPTP